MQNFTGMLEQRVQEVKLPNGLQFLVLQRTNAPIVSCHTHANVGAFDEVGGQTGEGLLSKKLHIRMLFKAVEGADVHFQIRQHQNHCRLMCLSCA